MTAITPTPIPTTKALVPAASSPIGFPAPASDADFNTGVGSGFIRSFSYDFEQHTGQPNVGLIYQDSGALGSISVNYIDQTGQDNTTFLKSLVVGDKLKINAVIFTIQAITVRSNNILFTVTPVQAASPPTGVMTVPFGHMGPLPIDPGGNSPPIVVNPATVIPGEPLSKTASANTYTLVLPTFAFMPLKHDATNIFNLSAVPPWKAAVPGTTNPTPPPLLTMTRTPPFPAYPS